MHCIAISALQPDNSNFLEVKIAHPVLELVGRRSVEEELMLPRPTLKKLNGDEKTKPTTTKLLSERCEALKAMPTIHLALKLEFTLGSSTAKCENSLSVLKTIIRDRSQSMKHVPKARLVQLALERDLTKS